jgi:Xaa-Pro aminopeptidase
MADFVKRVGKLKALMKEKGLETALITDKNDIFYYTGFRPSDTGAFLVERQPRLFVSRLDGEAELKSPFRVVFFKKLDEIRKHLEGKVIGFDENHLSADAFLKFKRKVKLKKASDMLKRPRLVKEPEELENIKKALKITGEVFRSLDISGRTESDVRREIGRELLERNSEPAFDPIVASGENSYFIHHRVSGRRIRKDDFVILDIGARFRGYCSDITRTVCYRPDRRKGKLMEDVKEIQNRIIDKIEVGMGFREIQKYYKKLMGGKFRVMHAFGHSTGLSVHEGFLRVEPNMVITVEPGVYIKGLGGCRFEDMVLVKKQRVEVLSENIRVGL